MLTFLFFIGNDLSSTLFIANIPDFARSQFYRDGEVIPIPRYGATSEAKLFLDSIPGDHPRAQRMFNIRFHVRDRVENGRLGSTDMNDARRAIQYQTRRQLCFRRRKPLAGNFATEYRDGTRDGSESRYSTTKLRRCDFSFRISYYLLGSSFLARITLTSTDFRSNAPRLRRFAQSARLDCIRRNLYSCLFARARSAELDIPKRLSRKIQDG